MQSFAAKGARANLSWWKVVQVIPKMFILGYGYWYYYIFCIPTRATPGCSYRVADGFVGAALCRPMCRTGFVYCGEGYRCCSLYLYLLIKNVGRTGRPLHGIFCVFILCPMFKYSVNQCGRYKIAPTWMFCIFTLFSMFNTLFINTGDIKSPLHGIFWVFILFSILFTNTGVGPHTLTQQKNQPGFPTGYFFIFPLLGRGF